MIKNLALVFISDIAAVFSAQERNSKFFITLAFASLVAFVILCCIDEVA